MIRIVPPEKFDHLVRLTVPGQAEPSEVTMTFRHMTTVQAEDWFKQQETAQVGSAIAEIVLGWRGVVDADGKDVEFSRETLEKLLAGYAPSAREIVLAWRIGLTESRVKN